MTTDPARIVTREALAALVTALDAVKPWIDRAQSIAFLHGWRYTGPEGGYGPALEAARAALAHLSPADSATLAAERAVVAAAEAWRDERLSGQEGAGARGRAALRDLAEAVDALREARRTH